MTTLAKSTKKQLFSFILAALFLPAAVAQVCESALGGLSTTAKLEFPVYTKLTERRLKAPIDLAPEMEAARREILQMIKNDAYRESMALTMESYLRTKSGVTKAKILGAKNPSYDVVIIGAGVHGIISAAAMMKANPQLRVLVVEKSDAVASTFRYARDSFRINSSNRASSEDNLALPGLGNINELPGLPIQVSDLTGEKYPSANDLAIALLSGMYSVSSKYSNVDLVFDTTVSSLERNRDGDVTGAKIKFAGINQTTKLASQLVIATTGLGVSKIPFSLKESKKTAEQLAQYQSLEQLPKVMTFDQAFRLISQKANPLKFFSRKKIGVVGQGDSGNVFIEFLLGYGPKKAYGNSDAQNKLPRRIYWFGQEARSCEEFIETARSRYAQIGTGFRSSAAKVRPILTSREKVQSAVEQKDDEGVIVTTVDGQETDVDYLIITTGFEQQIRKLFDSQARNDIEFFEDELKLITDNTSVSGKQEVAVGRVIKNAQTGKISFLVAGTAAGKIQKDDELFGIIQNSVSIFNNAPRVVEATKKAIKKIDPTPAYQTDYIGILSQKLDQAVTWVVTKLQSFRLLEAGGDKYFHAALLQISEKLVFQQEGRFEAQLQYDSQNNSVLVTSSEKNDLSGFVGLMIMNRDVANYVRSIAVNSDSVGGLRISANIVRSADGTFKIDASSFTLKLTAKTQAGVGQNPDPKAKVIENYQIKTER